MNTKKVTKCILALSIIIIVIWLLSTCQNKTVSKIQVEDISSIEPLFVSTTLTTNLTNGQEPQLTSTNTLTSFSVLSQTRWRLDEVFPVAVIQDETIFVVNPRINRLVAFDLDMETVAWENDEIELIVNPRIEADDQRLYGVTSTGLVAWDNTNGIPQWKSNLPVDGSYQNLTVIPEEEMIIYGDTHPFSDTHILYALNSQNGQPIWQKELIHALDWFIKPSGFLSAQRHSVIVYNHGQIYLRLALNIDGNVGALFAILALDAQTGENLWQFNFGIKQYPGDGPSFSADTLAFDDTNVFIPTYLGPVYVVDHHSGQLLETIDNTWTSLTKVEDMIVASAWDDGIVAFDQQSIRWTTAINDEQLSEIQIVVLDDYVFIVGTNSQIHVLSLSSGQKMETITLSNASECSQPLVLDKCNDQLCLVTLKCIYQFSINP